jgi:hypothetical protein
MKPSTLSNLSTTSRRMKPTPLCPQLQKLSRSLSPQTHHQTRSTHLRRHSPAAVHRLRHCAIGQWWKYECRGSGQHFPPPPPSLLTDTSISTNTHQTLKSYLFLLYIALTERHLRFQRWASTRAYVYLTASEILFRIVTFGAECQGCWSQM